MTRERTAVLVTAALLAVACSGTSGGADDIVLSSRLNRQAINERCEGRIACYGGVDPAEEESLTTMIPSGQSFNAEIVEITCGAKDLDFDPPEVDLTPIAAAKASSARTFSSGLVCTLEFPSFELTDGQGRPIVMTESAQRTRLTGAELTEVTCAGKVHERPRGHFVLAPADDGPTDVIAMPDDGAVELTREIAIVIDVVDCFEEVGTWSARGGELDGESGSYRMIWDSLELELTLERGSPPGA